MSYTTAESHNGQKATGEGQNRACTVCRRASIMTVDAASKGCCWWSRWNALLSGLRSVAVTVLWYRACGGGSRSLPQHARRGRTAAALMPLRACTDKGRGGEEGVQAEGPSLWQALAADGESGSGKLCGRRTSSSWRLDRLSLLEAKNGRETGSPISWVGGDQSRGGVHLEPWKSPARAALM